VGVPALLRGRQQGEGPCGWGAPPEAGSGSLPAEGKGQPAGSVPPPGGAVRGGVRAGERADRFAPGARREGQRVLRGRPAAEARALLRGQGSA